MYAQWDPHWYYSPPIWPIILVNLSGAWTPKPIFPGAETYAEILIGCFSLFYTPPSLLQALEVAFFSNNTQRKQTYKKEESLFFTFGVLDFQIFG